jgi:hypothetical protein
MNELERRKELELKLVPVVQIYYRYMAGNEE